MKISVIGCRGRIGTTLVRILEKGGHRVVYGADAGEDIDVGRIENSDLTVLAVPKDVTVDLIGKLSGRTRLVELSSVKSGMKKFAGKVISIHPLFGPNTVESTEFRTVLFIDDISPPGSLKIVQELFPGRDIHSVSSEEHDRDMADLLVAPYLMSMLAAGVLGRNPGFSTPSYAGLCRSASALDSENPAVVKDTISGNIFSREILDRMSSEIDRMRGELI